MFQTKKDLAADLIRKKILGGSFKPGNRINIDKFSRESGISKTPMREALNKLMAEGLVCYTPNIGYTVYEMSLNEYFQIYELQELLEVHLSVQMIPFKDFVDFEALDKINKKLMAALKEEDITLVQDCNDQFHMNIYKYYPNTKLLDQLAGIWSSVKIQRHLMYSSPLFVKTVLKEHQDIAESLRLGDPENLEKAVRDHFRSGEKALLDTLLKKDEGISEVRTYITGRHRQRL
ncbi:MAG TPA: GntR family transcriptional regulator [Synergistales bacterium]|nr:GntR family transcriptional regulator [Synergistales bacterium]HRU91351.1 GntR family transcriptional regulator [Thermovirgaceae bacterium]